MKVNDIVLNEAEGTNDYQKMLAFVKANGIQGLPQDQQIALALFRELQRQKQHNDQLDRELDAAEQRIDVATQSGELQQKALGRHQTELDKERSDISQQQAAIGKLDTTYAARDKASKQQLQDLTGKLEAVKSRPGIDPEVAEKLNQQIKEIEKKGVAADQVEELKRSIDNIQQQKTVDLESLNQLEQQLKDAQETAKAVQSKIGDVEDYKKEIDSLKAEVDSLENTLNKTITPTLKQQQQQIQQVDQTTKQLYALDTKNQAVNKISKDISKAQAAQAAGIDPDKLRALLPLAQQQQQQRQLNLPLDSDQTQQQTLPLKESKWQSTINWATGKTK